MKPRYGFSINRIFCGKQEYVMLKILYVFCGLVFCVYIKDLEKFSYDFPETLPRKSFSQTSEQKKKQFPALGAMSLIRSRITGLSISAESVTLAQYKLNLHKIDSNRKLRPNCILL